MAGIALIQERLRVLRAEREQEEASGASADIAFFREGRWSAILSNAYESLNKSSNPFENGYDSDIVSATIGVEYELTESSLVGLAFNYQNVDGDFDKGGGFNDESIGGLFYTQISPLKPVFLNAILGYWRKDFSRRRKTNFSYDTNDEDDVQIRVTIRDLIQADFDGDQYLVSAAAGYDHAISDFRIGPRLGLNWFRTETESYDEQGSTGLELSIDEQTETSLQTSLGLAASVPVETAFGTIVPQLSAAWIHEFKDDQRDVDAAFVQDFRPTESRSVFSFKTEKPDRDYGVISAGVLADLPNGLRPFVGFDTLIGNDRFDSYAVGIGVRLALPFGNGG